MIDQISDNFSSNIETKVLPTEQRYNHNGGVITETTDEEGGPTTRHRAMWENPLDAYRDLGFINAEEYKAGIKFQQIYYSTIMCRALNEHGMLDSDHMQIAKLDAVLKSALKVMPQNSRLAIIDVCGHSEAVQSAVKLNALKKGLGHLAVLWHAAAEEVCEHQI